MHAIDINNTVVLGLPKFKNENLHFRGKYGEDVEISAIYLFSLFMFFFFSLDYLIVIADRNRLY